MKAFLEKYAGIKTIAVLAAIFLSFNLFVFPKVLPVHKEPLDLQLSYSAEKAYVLISSYDDALRHTYMIAEMSLDVIYPVVYSLLFSFIIWLLYKNEQLAKVPFLILIADLIENTGIVLLLKNYPKQLPELATITGVFTSLKWGLVMISVLILLVGLFKKVASKKLKNEP